MENCISYSTCSETKAEAGVGMGKGQTADLGMKTGILQHIVCPYLSAPFSSSAVFNGKCTSGMPQCFRGMGTSKKLLTCVSSFLPSAPHKAAAPLLARRRTPSSVKLYTAFMVLQPSSLPAVVFNAVTSQRVLTLSKSLNK